MTTGTIVKVSGPLVIAEGMRDANMFDVVRVSEKHLIGEIIEMHGDRASIQVYEETAGLGPGEEVVSVGMPMSVELGPGLISTIYDGIQRTKEKLYEYYGIPYGVIDGAEKEDEDIEIEKDRTEAQILIMQGKPIPADLEKRLLLYKENEKQ